MKKDDLHKKIEAILFAAGKDISIKKLAHACGLSDDVMSRSIEELSVYCERERGVVIVRSHDSVRLATHPLCASLVSAFVNADMTGELTKPQLETLTIIAYRGPVMKTEMELIRGVNCTLIVRNLLMRGLIEEFPGDVEPTYAVTTEFLRFLGVGSTKALPDYETLSDPTLTQRLLEATTPSGVLGDKV